MAERSERGFALLMVLWWAALLALLGSQLAAAGRTEALRAGNLRSAAVADAAAAGALNEAVFHALGGSGDGWAADGVSHVIPVVGGTATVQIRSEAAKIGLNQASAGLLAALIARVGEPPRTAASLAAAILDWRTATTQRRPLGAKAADYQAAGLGYGPPDSDFETLDELGLVRGMTPELLRQLTPYLSVYQSGDPDLSVAGAMVRLAVAESGEAGLPRAEGIGLEPAAAPVVGVTVSVEMASGARARRRAVVRLAADPIRRPYQILDQD